jgi:hypothetical protein
VAKLPRDLRAVLGDDRRSKPRQPGSRFACPFPDVQQLTFALLGGEYAEITTVGEILA